ncbi:uncharacterized protein BYT42DRAFT_576883 [Radiomyces spectabilis]|uniref:uncharacterized protein n=1 Tax=Radiomyces spectabilis TaxID=64574 RepID=UPI002221138C|nr:uncharacterized protein BYT42DRAFT_576883 [Radiomyces spectabilis]KAI8374589.1 hypothetical protein BYT42DRAFT_576883 [Radiomyces spectabilis]
MNPSKQPDEAVPHSETDRKDDILPAHIPVDMAIAPDQQPYHTHVIHSPTCEPPEEDSSPRLAQHTLSPEKLGVTGYVKDVVGFVKDAVYDARDQKHRKSGQQGQASEQPHFIPAGAAEPAVLAPAQAPRESSPLVDTVIGLFPHLGDDKAAACTHAEQLRNDMMQTHAVQNPNDHRLL